MATIRDQFAFLSAGIRDPRHTGSVWPSSRALAREMTAPLRNGHGGVRVLEVGAGTGAITREILRHLGRSDSLLIFEMNPRLRGVLERLLEGGREAAENGPAIRLVGDSIETIDPDERFDFVLSGLPFNNFRPDRVERLVELLGNLRTGGGTLSYFEYAGFRSMRRLASPAAHALDRILVDFLARQRVERRLVLRNLPPAWVRHLREP